jgi:hypothetical protein
MLMPQGQIDRAAAAFHHPHAGAAGKIPIDTVITVNGIF